MEFCSAGDLFKFVIHTPPINPDFAAKFIYQICQGLLELKKKGLFHRDLKTENIFLG